MKIIEINFFYCRIKICLKEHISRKKEKEIKRMVF